MVQAKIHHAILKRFTVLVTKAISSGGRWWTKVAPSPLLVGLQHSWRNKNLIAQKTKRMHLSDATGSHNDINGVKMVLNRNGKVS